uniref:Tryptophan 2,3-dioxygenase n=1 Tax=Macrostomum lignano TaxID=282301 RepID=A0A1I8FS44_9PLAT
MRRVTSRPDMPCAVVGAILKENNGLRSTKRQLRSRFWIDNFWPDNLNSLLSCQLPVGQTDSGQPVHDEHLFIVTHQAFELWFKQVIFEIDSVRQLFSGKVFDEGKMLLLLTEQIMILETMTPLDFMDFRRALEPASGFQSLQFRLLENKLGVREDLRVNTTGGSSPMTTACGPWEESSAQPSLLDLVQRWLERTPGLNRTEDCDFQFWEEYKMAVERMLHEEYLLPAERETDPSLKQLKMADYKKQLDAFHSIDNLEAERNFSHKSFQGALMIALYRDEPRFSQPFHLLTLLMDTDALLTNTCRMSDRYKPFVDLFNLSTFLIPRSRIPPLTPKMKRSLSIILRGKDEDEVEKD